MGWQRRPPPCLRHRRQELRRPRQPSTTSRTKTGCPWAACVRSGVSRFGYTYDFGDDWEHAITIEKTLPAAEGTTYPTCVAGKRACPPEDCGGPWGYQELLEIIADPAHPERAERLEWLGEDFDPEDFSLEAVNTRLAGRFGHK